jgi:hypothetical protein
VVQGIKLGALHMLGKCVSLSCTPSYTCSVYFQLVHQLAYPIVPFNPENNLPFFFLEGLEFEVRASRFTLSPFCSRYFGDGSLMNHLPGLALNCDLPNQSPK